MPSGVDQARPRLPRPLSCFFVTSQSLPGSPAAARSRATAFGTYRLEAFETVALIFATGESAKLIYASASCICQKNVLAAASAKPPIGPAMKT